MLDFIVNPIAGGKHGKKTRKTVSALETILNEKGVDYKMHLTREKGHAKYLTESLIENGSTDIIVVGGDGTLHEVINGFSNFDRVNLGLIPCGTGNDFATAAKIPLNVRDALEIVTDGEARYTDFMQMPTVRGINVIGTGIDVEVLKKYEKLKRKNRWGYTKCLIKTLLDFEYSNFTTEIDGKKTSYRSFVAAIANGSDFGGGIPICPIANPADGSLDFVAVKAMKRLGIIGAFIKLKQGKVLSLKQAVTEPVKNIKIICEKPATINVDGELYENVPFEVTVVSNTLKMYR